MDRRRSLLLKQQGSQYERQYLTIEILEDNTALAFEIPPEVDENYVTSISYSIDDGATWTTVLNDDTMQIVSLEQLNTGDKVLWKGIASAFSTDYSEDKSCAFMSIGFDDSAGRVRLSGNIMSMLYGDNFYNQKILEQNYTFCNLFSEFNVADAGNLILPATTLTEGCYGNMFKGCTSLETAPELPATTLEIGCYSGMFQGCTSLETAPELPAPVVSDFGYEIMFDGCSSLNYISVKATSFDGPQVEVTWHWLQGVASRGTFVCPDASVWVKNSDSGIPIGWGVQDDSSTDIVYYFAYRNSAYNITLSAGTYKLECWGAQGGYTSSSSYAGGKGGYSVGFLTLADSTTVYVRTGGKGTDASSAGAKAGGFNGGGNAYASSSYLNGAGGGASDIRIGTDSLYARIIVAGGGGGAGSYGSSNRYSGGAGGGTSGKTPSQYSTSYKAGTGGTQSAKGTSYYSSTADSTTYGTLADFGTGGGRKGSVTSYYITGGGGGWYGGGYSYRGAGGGGSGYVYNADTAVNYPSGCLLNSDYYLDNSATYDGTTSNPSVDGNTETGHSGNGYVRITLIDIA